MFSVFCETSFQFHIGAIKTALVEPDEDLLREFQFHIGAIKTLVQNRQPIRQPIVSIPHWCD